MDKKEKDCGYWIVVLLTGVAIGGLGGFALLGSFHRFFQMDGFSSWLSAIGTFFAAIVALWVSTRQMRTDREKGVRASKINVIFIVSELESLLDLMCETSRLMSTTWHSYKSDLPEFNTTVALEESRVEIERLLQRLRGVAFDFKALADSDVNIELLEIIAKVIARLQAISLEHRNPIFLSPDSYAQWLEDADEEIKKMRTEINFNVISQLNEG